MLLDEANAPARFLSANRIETPLADPVRARLAELMAARGEDHSSLSRAIGRNLAYMQQFMVRGTPKKLDEADRLKLAMHFQIDERELGARDPWTPG